MPENTNYMIAGYIVAAVIVLVYAVSLFVRLRQATKHREP